MKIEIINTSNHDLPNYETILSAGMDLRAVLEEPVTIGSLDRVLIKTGLFMALPQGYEAQVIAKYERAEWTVVKELSETERGTGGFGSTGVK